MSLTDTKIRAIKATGKEQWLGDGHGLYLRVHRGGAKTWIVRRKRKGKTQVTTLGHYPTLSLKHARAKAAEYQLSPDLSTVTVGELVRKYMTEVVEPTHRRADIVDGYMRRAVLPEFKSRKVREVTRGELVALVQDYSRNGARTADQLRSNLKKLFGYAVELGYIDRNPMLEVTRRVSGYDPTPRDRVLDDDEIRLLWNEANHNAACCASCC